MATRIANVHRDKDESVRRQSHRRTATVVWVLALWLIAKGFNQEPKLPVAKTQA